MVAQEDEIDKLEKERTQLLKRLRVKALERGERAAKKGMPVEQLAALEELAAELDTDPDFEGERVGAARLRVEAQQQAPRERATTRIDARSRASCASFARARPAPPRRRRRGASATTPGTLQR